MNKLFNINVLSEVISTKCTFICPVSSAQTFRVSNTLNIRIRDSSTPDTVLLKN